MGIRHVENVYFFYHGHNQTNKPLRLTKQERREEEKTLTSGQQERREEETNRGEDLLSLIFHFHL